jgi:hypothetical protein
MDFSWYGRWMPLGIFCSAIIIYLVPYIIYAMIPNILPDERRARYVKIFITAPPRLILDIFKKEDNIDDLLKLNLLFIILYLFVVMPLIGWAVIEGVKHLT